MSTPEAQNSISSAVFGLQDTLKQLKQQWPVLKKPEAVPNGKKNSALVFIVIYSTI
jgi:hypothetical protein